MIRSMILGFAFSVLTPSVPTCVPADFAAQSRAADLTPEAVFEQTGLRRGLFVVVDKSPDLAIGLARAEPVLVHVLAPDLATAEIRQRLVSTGCHGRVTVNEFAGTGRLPLADNTAAVVLADFDRYQQVDHRELLRVLRPWGKAVVKKKGVWDITEKPVPDDTDDWPQYFHDAANSDHSLDRRAGPARGLQWEAGPHHRTKIGVRVVGDVWLGVDAGGLVARDAYSGLPRWRRRDIDIDNRYAFLADAERVYYYPRIGQWQPPPAHMRVLDLTTGEDLATLKEGVMLDAEGWVRGKHDWGSFRKDFPDDWKQRLRRARDNAETLQARLDDGVLVQVAVGEMAVLDARSGKRLWRQTAPAARGAMGMDRHGNPIPTDRWHHPLIHAGRVYVVAGESTPSWSYTHWPMGAVRSIHAFEVKTGKQLWRWDWPKDAGDPGAAYNMVLSDRRLALALRTDARAKSSAGLLLVDRATGKDHRLLTDTTYGDRSVGGGHSHLRVLCAGGKLWINSAIGQHGGADPADPGDKSAWLTSYNKLPRPVGCTVWRATPNWLFGSLSVYALDGSQIRHTNVARTACDVGAFPAAGMSFITPNHCFCQPYLPGFNAFHPRAFAGTEEFDRLNEAEPVPAQASSPAAHDAWPMFLADTRRSSWNEHTSAAKLQPLWKIQPLLQPAALPTRKASGTNAAPVDLLAAEWSGNWYCHGPVTPLSVAGGVAIGALTNRQQVVALEADTGRERWRRAVDGRIDCSPTLRGSFVYTGTRAGWVYALNRDTGELAWRFFAAPRRERIVAFGQLESPWPVHGSVLVDEDGVWIVAGRHNDVDGGLWWWNLDPITGRPRSGGRLGQDQLRGTTGGSGSTDAPDIERMNGANTPAVSDGRLVLLAGVWLTKRAGRLVPWDGLQAGGEYQRWAVRFPLDILVPGNQGLLNRSETLSGYKMSYYGLTQAPFLAYGGEDFVTVDGTTTIEHRGGGRDRRSMVRRFRKYDAIREEIAPGDNRRRPRGAEVLWETDCAEADKTGVKALAVTGDTVLVGFSVDNRDHWRARDAMPYRLRVISLDTGQRSQDDLPLPAPPVQGGISAAGNRVFVVTSDGTITCFGPPSS